MTPEPKTAGSKSPSATSRRRAATTSPRPAGVKLAAAAGSNKAAVAGKPAASKPAAGKPAASKRAAANGGAAAQADRRGKGRASQPAPELAIRRSGGKAATGKAATGKAATGKAATGKAATGKAATGKAATPKAAAAGAWGAGDIGEAFQRFEAANPEPRGELAYVNPFTLLVAVVLSAQATDAGVNKATPALFTAADTPEKMVALGEDRVRDMIKTIGLFRTKARNVIALSERLLADHGGMVPPVREELEKLPGVGRKTANVVLNIAFGEETIAVDTHIFRVGNRTGMAPGRNPREVETALEHRVPKAYRRHAHHWLILHGRYVCKAQRPLCEKCLIADLCRWPQKTTFMAATA